MRPHHAADRAPQTVTLSAAVLVYRYIEPGQCMATPESEELLSQAELRWKGHACYPGQWAYRGRGKLNASELDAEYENAMECPLGFRCRGVGRSVMHTLYFVVVTTTTVGYGDVTPRTDAGRLVAVVPYMGSATIGRGGQGGR